MSVGMWALNYNNINSFSVAERLDLQQGNGGTFQVQLNQAGSRYVPPVGSTVQITFPRALSIAPTPSNQDTIVAATVVDTRDASVLQFTLTATQVDKIVSEGVKLSITTAGVTSTWPVDHFVRRRSSAPGA